MAELLTITRKGHGKALFFDGTNKAEVKEHFLTADFLKKYASEEAWFAEGGNDFCRIPFNNSYLTIPKGTYIVEMGEQRMALTPTAFAKFYDILEKIV